MKRQALLLLLVLAGLAPAFSEGLYLDGGISVNMSNYGNGMDDFLRNYFEFHGLNRFVFGGNFSAGYRIVPGLYINGTFLYTRDMVRGFGYDINLHSAALLAGLRWYPLAGRRFLQLGIDAGPSWLFFSSNIAGVDNQSGAGPGVNALVAYDFNPSFNGPHWQLAMNFLYSNINGGSVFTPGVSLKISYQKTKNVGSEIDFGANEMSAAAGVTIPLAIMIVTWIGFNLIPPDNNL